MMIQGETNQAISCVPCSTDDDDHYPEFLAALRARFDAEVAGGAKVFTTAADGLFDAFLAALPEDKRKHYDCRACRRFVDRFGGLVTIREDGAAIQLMWSTELVPSFFSGAVVAVGRIVERAKVNGVFLCDEPTWGLPSNNSAKGIWRHMAVIPGAALVHRPTTLLSTSQAMAEKVQDYGMLQRGLTEFSIDVVRQAHTMLTTGALYRSEKCIGVAKWMLALHEARATTKNSVARDNLTWLAVATAPAGFCHVRSSMIGTLLEDIAAGMAFADIKRRFDEKMSPLQYQRPTAAPTAGNLAQAEKVVAELAATGALTRRFARLEDVLALWKPKAAKVEQAPAGGVFAHLKPKAAPAVKSVDMPAVTMTWEKFARTVLPTAERIEALVPTSTDRFMAMVTAADPEAPPILQWDNAESRNAVSWYYQSGIDGEIKRRVISAGGTHADCDIRASLIWNNRNDLDLHVITPSGEHIFFAARRSRCGGWLDVDMNVRGETTEPVENIRWTKGAARSGRYQVYVENYRFHEYGHAPTAFRVELEINGDVFHYDGVASPRRETGVSSDVTVAIFDYAPGRRVADMSNVRRAVPDGAAWGVTPGQWSKVAAISESPNLWGDRPMKQHGEHVFFLLDGCKDAAGSAARGFFVETLRSEFHHVRRTIEAYAQGAAIQGAEEATAAGIGLSKGPSAWDQILRVTSAAGQVTYKLDRWD